MEGGLHNKKHLGLEHQISRRRCPGLPSLARGKKFESGGEKPSRAEESAPGSQLNRASGLGAGKGYRRKGEMLPRAQVSSQDRHGGRMGCSELCPSLAASSPPLWVLQGDTGETGMGFGGVITGKQSGK